MRWLWVYGMLTALVLTLSFARALLFFDATVTAATRIHDAMAACVLRAPLAFFHTNPAGRVLNRWVVVARLPGCAVQIHMFGFGFRLAGWLRSSGLWLVGRASGSQVPFDDAATWQSCTCTCPLVCPHPVLASPNQTHMSTST